MSFLISSASKDLVRWSRDSVSVLLWLGIPFLIGGLLTLLMSADGAKPRGTLLIHDKDQTFLSGAIGSAFTQGQLGELIVVEMVTELDGEARIDAGDASAFLLIPEGFSTAILNAEPLNLLLTTNPAQTILPQIIGDVVEVLLDAGFYAQQMFASEISTALAAGNAPDSVLVANIAVSINEKLEAAGPLLFPPAFDIEILAPPAEQPSPPIALLFLPGIVLMAVLLAANGLAADYWSERELGTLRRLMYTPGRIQQFLLGKALAVAVITLLLAGLTLVAGFVYHGIPFAHFLPSLLFVTVAGVALFSWFGLLQMLANSRRAANLLTTILLFPLLMIGGSFFPFAAMPDGLAAIGRLTPNGFVVDRLTTEITGQSAWSINAGSWLLLLVATTLGLICSGWRLRNGFARS